MNPKGGFPKTVEHPFNKNREKALQFLIFVNSTQKFLQFLYQINSWRPNFDTPEHIKEAAIQAIKDNSHYTQTQDSELPQAAADYYQQEI